MRNNHLLCQQIVTLPQQIFLAVKTGTYKKKYHHCSGIKLKKSTKQLYVVYVMLFCLAQHNQTNNTHGPISFIHLLFCISQISYTIFSEKIRLVFSGQVKEKLVRLKVYAFLIYYELDEVVLVSGYIWQIRMANISVYILLVFFALFWK